MNGEGAHKSNGEGVHKSIREGVHKSNGEGAPCAVPSAGEQLQQTKFSSTKKKGCFNCYVPTSAHDPRFVGHARAFDGT